jgi:signal transduction histidine kinase/CheY-like chemotaxis protein
MRLGLPSRKTRQEIMSKLQATSVATGARQTKDLAGLDDVITTAELCRRPSRPPQHAAENRALIALARTLATSPRSVLRELLNVAIEMTGAGSAGISVAETDGGARIFRWRATAGAFAQYAGGTMPRDFSPCGVVLDRNAAQLMADPVRYWPYISDLWPHVSEVLLIPFYGGDDVPLGTVWLVAHPGDRPFDAEDERVMQSLSRFASAAVQCIDNLDALEAANRSKDRFMAVLSHELRTPLTPVLLTATAMVEDQSLPAQVREDAQTIRRNLEFETRLIDDLLDVSRIAAGKVELRRQIVDLHAMLRQCADNHRAIAAGRGISVEFDPGARLHVASGDLHRLRQVFSNVVGNAIKFTPDGGKVTIVTSNAGEEIRVAVRDTGIGIEPDVLPSIFESFEQGGPSTTSNYGGLGLGLAIAKGFVEAHGGRIAAASAGRGMGTTITVHLAAAGEAMPAITPQAAIQESAPGLNILLVEDHEDSLNVMARLLRMLRYTVETATTATAALSVAERFDIDLLISDVGLPDRSGNELIRELLLKKPILGIALTGYGAEADIAETTAAGFMMHLTKPVRFDELKDALCRVAMRRASEKAAAGAN